jgi:hypothetical protein
MAGTRCSRVLRVVNTRKLLILNRINNLAWKNPAKLGKICNPNATSFKRNQCER